MLSLQTLVWLCLAAYALHILEEFSFDWRSWARAVIHLPVLWEDFYITNCLVVVLGVVAAEIAPYVSVLATAFPCLMLINATFFHVLPFLRTRGRFSPGLITSLLLFYPLGLTALSRADLQPVELAISFLLGAGLHAAPVVCILLRQRPYFDQTKAVAAEAAVALAAPKAQ